MTNKNEKKTDMLQNEMINASKQWVSQTRNWATTMREAMLTPWEGFYRENEITNMMFGPWVSMTRVAHDRWLDMFETQVNEVLERSNTMFNQFHQ